MKKRKGGRIVDKFISIFIIAIMMLSLVPIEFAQASEFQNPASGSFAGSASTSVSNIQSSSPSFSNPAGFIYSNLQSGSSSYREKESEGFFDLMIAIPPGGCQPYVVRSDLLEEQNVPVFCKISAMSVNPGVDISRIGRIAFRQTEQNPYIAGIGFRPSQAAIRASGKLINNPTTDNLGYVVVVLKQQEKEADMPDRVTAELSAVLEYDAENTFGIGQTEFYLPVISDEEFESNYNDYGFWNGVGYLRAESIEGQNARISIYAYDLQKVQSAVLGRGRTSEDIFIPTQTGGKGIKIVLRDIAYPDVKAKIKVNGEEYEVYKGGQFSDYNCRLWGIYPSGAGTGKVSISCEGGVKKFDLTKNFGKIRIGTRDYEVRKKVDEDENVYLAYASVYPKESGQKSKQYAILVRKLLAPRSFGVKGSVIGALVWPAAEILGKLASLAGGQPISDVEMVSITRYLDNKIKSIRKDADFADELKNIQPYYSRYEYTIIDDTDANLQNAELGDADTSYVAAKDSYNEVIEKFGAEKYLDVTYSQRALCNKFLLAKELKQEADKKEFLLELVDKHPGSFCGDKPVEDWLYDEGIFSSEGSTYSLDEKNLYFELVSVTEPRAEDASVEIVYTSSLGSETKTLTKGYEEQMADETTITLRYFDESSAKFDYSCKLKSILEGQVTTAIKNKVTKLNQLINEGGSMNIEECDAKISVSKINLNKVAKVKIIPNTYGRSRETNFTFTIGIEKRAEFLKLSPEQAEKRIKQLNETIAKWNEISGNLGNVVKGMKGACLATSMALQLKNLFSGLTGEATARRKIMSEVWNKRCEDSSYKASKGYDSAEECLLGEAGKINSDVAKMQAEIKSMNKNVEKLDAESGAITPGLLGISKTIDTEKSKNAYLAYLQSKYGQTYPDLKNINADDFTYEELKDIELSIKFSGDATFTGGSTYATKLTQALDKIKSSDAARIAERQAAAKVGLKPEQVGAHIGDKIEVPYAKQTWKDFEEQITGVSSEVKRTDKVEVIELNSMHYLYILGAGTTSLYPKEIYALSGVDTNAKTTATKIFPAKDEAEETSALSKMASVFISLFGKSQNSDLSSADYTKLKSVRFIEGGSYNNKIKNYDEIGAKFFSFEPYKGMPALVPFDKVNGWYAAAEQNVPVFGNSKSYLDSGAPNSFYICNVGADETINGIGIGDDECTGIDISKAVPDTIFGKSTTETSRLITRAREALREASKQIQSNPEFINIGGMKLRVKNVEGALGSKCTDFMSPSDCLIMFNLCDPVVCPSSRCDMGGAFRVDDVIQSGIIGSIALCLPNLKEGVVIPVCLTGIHAGIEGWISVLSSYRDCLQESISTGKMTGICDEIHSVYVCDFWWKQIGPFLGAITKNIFSWITGEGIHGGGEYLFVQDAFNNAEKSFQFFTNTYASTSKLGFGARSFAEIGSEVCKMQLSATYPDKFGSVLEPESPYQIYAWFDEMPYTDATVPPTSQYKVFYHIFAGNDQGHYYQVYLKSHATTIGYTGKPYQIVASGYVGKGETATQTADHLDVSGFKELCIRIDTKDHCGFKSVSTNFAINYAKEEVIKEQVSEKVTTEKACKSGTAHVGNMLTPNLQSGIEGVVSPELYNQGITRVCATTDPGKGVDGSRWQNIGYCDNEKIRCWIDINSVENSLKGKGIESETIKNIEKNAKQLANPDNFYLEEEKANEEITKIENAYNAINSENLVDMKAISTEAAALDKQIIFNYQRARLLWAKAITYDRLAKELRTNIEALATVESTGTGTAPVAGTVSEEAESDYTINVSSKVILFKSIPTNFRLDTSWVDNALKFVGINRGPSMVYHQAPDNKISIIMTVSNGKFKESTTNSKIKTLVDSLPKKDKGVYDYLINSKIEGTNIIPALAGETGKTTWGDLEKQNLAEQLSDGTLYIFWNGNWQKIFNFDEDNQIITIREAGLQIEYTFKLEDNKLVLAFSRSGL